jgi:hypothetical protein
MTTSLLSLCCLKADPDHTIVDAMFYTKVLCGLFSIPSKSENFELGEQKNSHKRRRKEKLFLVFHRCVLRLYVFLDLGRPSRRTGKN